MQVRELYTTGFSWAGPLPGRQTGHALGPVSEKDREKVRQLLWVTVSGSHSLSAIQASKWCLELFSR